MRTSVASLSKKFISTFFAATLALGLVPAAAFAAPEDATIAANETTTTDDGSAQGIATAEEPEAPVVDIEAPEGGAETPDIISDEVSLDASGGAVSTEDPQDANVISIPAAMERINEDVALTRPVAQQESTRSYFLAQTLESTKTVPIVSANLPLDKGTTKETVEPIEDEGSTSSDDEGGEDSDESDLPTSNIIAADSTVIGSFEYQGIVYALEPGGETVAVIAADYNKLPSESIEAHTIVIPSMAPEMGTYGIDYFSVTRIADYAFASLTSEVASNHVISSEVGEADAVEESALLIEDREADTDSASDAENEESSTDEGITILGVPSSITSIDDNAFSGFDTLQYIVVEKGNLSYASYDGALYSADLTNLRLIPEGRVGAVRVAPSATAVEPEAFSHCPSVDAVVADPESEIYLVLEEVLIGTPIAVEAPTADTTQSPTDRISDPFDQIFESISDLDGTLLTDSAVQMQSRNLSAVRWPGCTFYIAAPKGSTVYRRVGKSTPLSGATIYQHDSCVTYPYSSGSFDIYYTKTSLTMENGTASMPIYNHAEGSGYVLEMGLDSSMKGVWQMVVYYYSADGKKLTGNAAVSGQSRALDITDYRTPGGYAIVYLNGAHWVDITCDPNGEGATTSSATIGARRGDDVTLPEAKRPGYRCTGWYTSSTGGTKVGDNDETIVMPTIPSVSGKEIVESTDSYEKAATYPRWYAQWEVTGTYTITLNKNGSDAATGTSSLCQWKGVGWYTDTNVNTKAGSITAPTRPGYRFKGYSQDPNATTADYWKTDTTTASTIYSMPGNTSFSSNTILYAVWDKLVYAITLDKNADDAVGGVTVLYLWYKHGWYWDATAEDEVRNFRTPTRPGYRFRGYADTSGATATATYWTTDTISSVTVWDMLENDAFTYGKTIYAKWDKAVFEITLNKNHIDATAGTETMYEWHGKGWYSNEAATTSKTSITAPTRSGYRFLGYATSSTATIASYWTTTTTTASSVNNPSNTTFTSAKELYAVWSPDVFEVILNDNNGSGGSGTIYLKYNTDWYTTSAATTKKTSITAPTRAGYTFLGYSTSKNATAADYWTTSATTAVTLSTMPSKTAFTSKTTLYAVWSPRVFAITLDSNGGTGGSGTIYEKYDDAWYTTSAAKIKKLSIIAPTWAGHKFLGYSISDTATEATYWKTETTSATAVTTMPDASSFSDVTTLYAVWSLCTYTITWEMKGHGLTQKPSTTGYTYGDAYELPILSDDGGWQFRGWYVNSACTAAAQDITSDTTGNKIFYAKWSEKTYAIKYDMNGQGEAPSSPTEYEYNKSTALPDPNEVEGWVFGGWYWNSACTTGEEVSITPSTTGDITVYAKWTRVVYAITWDMKGHGTNQKPSKDSYTYGDTYTLPAISDDGGWKFGGWYADSDCTTAAENIEPSTTGDKIFCAKWLRGGYSIQWDMQGHGEEQKPTKTAYTYGENYSLPWINDVTGWKFGGWYTNSECTVEASDITETDADSKVFYAKWTRAVYPITWDMKGHGTNQKPSKDSYTYGDTYTLPAISDDGGWKFGGWYADSDCTTAAENIEPSTTGDKIFYAKWAANAYKIEYIMNGHGKAPTSLTSYEHNTAPALPDPEMEVGWNFGGWYWDKDCTTGQEAAITTSSTGDKTVYAKWTVQSWPITWRTNGHGTTPTRTSYDYGESYTLPILSETGWTFGGWYIDAGLKTEASDIDSTTSGSKTFYAKWDRAIYTITWNMKDHGTAPDKTSYTYGETYSLPPVSNVTGWDFKGWFTNDACTNAAVDITEETNGNKTFYAKWERATYVITWNMQGHGTNQKPSKDSYTYGDTYQLPSISDVTGWKFGGWYTNSACTSAAQNITETTSGSKTFYAKWTREGYKIEWDMKGHGTSPTRESYTYGDAYILPSVSNVTGWTFGGWYTDSDCTRVASNITSTTTGDKKYYAKWTVNTHTVSWKYGGAAGKTDYDAKNVDYGTDVCMIEPGTKPGWTFAGWQAAGADKNSYGYGNNEKMTMPDGNVTLTAQWTKLDRIAVSLADKRLGEGVGKIWYWPEQGYIQTEDSVFPVQPNSTTTIATPPNVSGYQFLGWFATEDQNDNDSPMIDGKGILHATSAPGNVMTWYAHWKRVSCPVILAASYEPDPGEAAFAVIEAGDGSVPFAHFDEPFASSVEGGVLKVLPKRTGYTFMGYYTEKNQEMSVANAADASKYKGVQWIDKSGSLSLNTWNLYPTEERTSIMLYAAWCLDECEVVFDATSNAAPNTERVVVVNEESLKSMIWRYGKPKDAMTVPSEDTFYRNGYEFGGWYFLKDANGQDVESNRQFVSDSKGKPTPANWDVVKTSVTLYPAWTAKTYMVELQYNYPTVEGAPAEEVTMREIGPIAYDTPLNLSDYEPSYLFYTFENWYAKATDQLFEGAHMTANADGTKRFTPRGMVAQTNPIEVYARWMDPGKSSYSLYVGTPGGTELVSETQHEYKWTETIVFNGTEAPALVENYRFVGWVWVESDDAARKMIAAGGPEDTDETWSGFGPLSTKNLYFVAKWAPVKLSLALQSTQTEDDSAWLVSTDILENYEGQTPEGVKSWEETCESLNEERFDLARFLHYDTTQDAFVLPDVVRKGQTFLGWKLKGSPEPARRGVVVRPDTQDNAEMRDLVYIPVFKDAIYKIVLDGQGIGETKEYPNIAYSESFTFPYPATLNTGSVFACWSSKPDTNSDAAKAFFPLGEPTPLAPVYDETGNVKEDGFGLAQIAEVDEDGNNVIRVYAVWNSDYHVDVPLFANLAIDTERGDVIAGVNTISPDDRNKDADATYRIESIRYEPLKNKEGEDGKYAFEGAEDKVYLSVYAGLNTGEATDLEHLLYAENIDRDGGADGEVTYTDADGNIAKAKPLLIELGGKSTVLYGRTAPTGQASLESVTDADAPYGFVTFSASNPLTIRYGLYFESDQTRKDFAFGSTKYAWLLPENDATNKAESIDPGDANFGRRNAWSGNTVDIAKLHYTVSLVSNTK